MKRFRAISAIGGEIDNTEFIILVGFTGREGKFSLLNTLECPV